MAGVRGAGARILHRRHHRRSVWSRARPLCAVWRGSRARAHRRIGQHHGMPIDTSRGRSSLTSQAKTIGHSPSTAAMHIPLPQRGSIATGPGKLQVQPCLQCSLATVGPKKAACREGPNPEITNYSITKSASCWICEGTSRPRALAVFRFITSSNFAGA
jgi:hypothetical protein